MDDLPGLARPDRRYRRIERGVRSFTRRVSIMGALFVAFLLAMFPMLLGWLWMLALLPALPVGAPILVT